MIRSNGLDDVIGLIYEAALEPELWPNVLRRITHHGDASCTVLLALEPSTAQPRHVLFDRWPGYDAYVAYYASIDPRNARALRLPAGTKLTDYDITTEVEMARSEFYQDYLLPNEMGYVGAKMLKSDRECVAGITMQRTRRQGPFQPHELEILDRLAPHLNRALRLQTRFAALDAQQWADQIVRDRLAFAVVLVDEGGRIASQNQAATNLLSVGDDLTARHGRLRTWHHADQAALDQLIRSAAGTAQGKGADGGGMISLRRASLRHPLSAFVIPIARRRSAFSLELGAPIPAVVVIISDRERVPTPPEDALQCLYGLTLAEAKLAAAFAAGETLRDYAEAAKLSLNYVRWLLKQIQAKTDTHSQVELVRVLIGHAAQLAPPEKFTAHTTW